MSAIVALYLVGVGSTILLGCSTDAHPDRFPQTSNASAEDQNVDPKRAYLKLQDVKPSPKLPTVESPPKPLSSRAAKQLTEARALIEQQRYTEASLSMERALRYAPKHPDIHRELAKLHWQAGNTQRSETHARRALDGNPLDAVSHYIVGRCLGARHEQSDAISAFRQALNCALIDVDRKTVAEIHFHLAVSLEAEGYLTASLEAFDAFEKLLSSAESASLRNDLLAQRNQMADSRSSTLERLGRFQDAALALQDVLEDDPDDWDRRMRTTRLRLRAKQFEKALETARRIPTGQEGLVALLTEICERRGEKEAIVDVLRDRMLTRPGDAQLVRHLGEALIRFDRHDEAVDVLTAFLADHPDSATVRLLLVDSLFTQSRWGQGLRQSAEGIQHSPNRLLDFETKIRELAHRSSALSALLGDHPTDGEQDANVAYLTGRLADFAGRSDKAKLLWQATYQRDPSFLPARVALATLLLREYDYDRALAVARRRDADVVEDFRLERVLGTLYERLDNLEQAERHFKAAVRADRDNAESMLDLANVLRAAGLTNRAQLQLRLLLEAHPDHDKAHETLAFLYLNEGKVDAAMDAFRALGKTSKSPWVKTRCQALIALRRRSDLAAYRNTLTELIEREGDDVDTWMDIARSYNEFEMDKARDAYRKVLAIEPDNEDAADGLWRADRRLLNFEAAAQQLWALLPRRPNRHAWRLHLIELQVIVQYYDGALAVAESAAQRDDLDDDVRASYRNWIGRLLELTKNKDEHLARLKAWSAATPDDETARLRLAQTYAQYDQHDAALTIFRSLHESDPDDKGRLRSLISALVDADRTERALQYSLQWLFDDPDDNQALSILVLVLAGVDRPDDALELIDNRLLSTHERERFQNLAGLVLRGAERYDEDIERTEKLIDEVTDLLRRVSQKGGRGRLEAPSDEQLAVQPDSYSLESLQQRLDALQIAITESLSLAKEYREVERRIQSWLPETREPRARFMQLLRLSAALQAQGKAEEAADVTEQALAMQPDSVGLNNDVAYGLIDRGHRLEDAERMIRFAVSRSPTQPAYLDTFGWLLYKKQDFEGAKKWLSRGVAALTEGDPVILDHLGDACFRLGQKEQAVKHWKAAVDLLKGSDQEEANADVRRAFEEAPAKIEAVQRGDVPAVSPVAAAEDGDHEDSEERE